MLNPEFEVMNSQDFFFKAEETPDLQKNLKTEHGSISAPQWLLSLRNSASEVATARHPQQN